MSMICILQRLLGCCRVRWTGHVARREEVRNLLTKCYIHRESSASLLTEGRSMDDYDYPSYHFSQFICESIEVFHLSVMVRS
jgi:hypothetical protein